MAFKELVIGLALGGLLAVALIMFAAQTSIDNETNNSIINIPEINSVYLNLNDSLTETQSIAKTQQEAFVKDNPSIITFFSVLPSVGTAVIAFINMIMGIINLLFDFIYVQLGIPPLVTFVLFATMVIIIIFLAWRTFRAGD